MTHSKNKIGIGLNCVFYERDFDIISLDQLRTLKQMYKADKKKASEYVFNALRRRRAPKKLFDGHSSMPYISVKEYGNDGFNSLIVYRDGEPEKELLDDIKKIKIHRRTEPDELTKLCARKKPCIVVGYHLYVGEETEFYTDIEGDSFDIKKLKLFPSVGFDEKQYGGDISITPTVIEYDGKISDELQYSIHYDFRNPNMLELFGVVVDKNGRTDYYRGDEEASFDAFLDSIVKE